MTKLPIIVVEGAVDATILKGILRGAVQTPPKIMIAGGRSSAVSLARTILVGRSCPIAVVLDADTKDPRQIAQTHGELEASLAAAGSTAPFWVCVAVPTIEAWLWRDVDGLRRFFNGAWPAELEIEARFAPKDVIERLFGQQRGHFGPDAAGRLIDVLDLDRIRCAQEVKELVAFLTRFASTVAS